MNRYFVAEDGSLKIQKLAMEDGGMFQCVASNSAGQATAYTWLKVKSKSRSPSLASLFSSSVKVNKSFRPFFLWT